MISKKLYPKPEAPDTILDGGGCNGKICEEVKKDCKDILSGENEYGMMFLAM